MSEHGARILVVDDDDAILRSLERNLRGHDFQVSVARTAAEALALHEKTHPDVIVLDLGLPDRDGFSIIRAVREGARTPIVVLSARGADRDKVQALNLGADDYLTKPFSVDEMLARIRVVLRHTANPPSGAEPIFRTAELSVDLERRRVLVAGREVRLTPTEYELLRVFIRYPNRVLTGAMLLESVWGQAASSDAHYLHVYVARLRQKIEPDPQHPRYITNEPGVGYRLLAEDRGSEVVSKD